MPCVTRKVPRHLPYAPLLVPPTKNSTNLTGQALSRVYWWGATVHGRVLYVV